VHDLLLYANVVNRMLVVVILSRITLLQFNMNIEILCDNPLATVHTSELVEDPWLWAF